MYAMSQSQFTGYTIGGKQREMECEGTSTDDILRKIAEYGERYGVDYVIDTEPLGIRN